MLRKDVGAVEKTTVVEKYRPARAACSYTRAVLARHYLWINGLMKIQLIAVPCPGTAPLELPEALTALGV